MFGKGSVAAVTATVALACLPGAAASATGRAAPRRSANPLRSFVHAEFRSTARYAQVVALSAERVPAGATIEVACAGRRAPRVHRTLVATRPGTMNLAPLFGQRHLYVGDRISITISDGGATRHTIYTIRARVVAVAARR